jgi:cytochrome P450
VTGGPAPSEIEVPPVPPSRLPRAGLRDLGRLAGHLLRGAPRHPPGTRLAPLATYGLDPFAGHVRALRRAPLETFCRIREEVGDLARLRLGPTTAHLVGGDPGLVRQVLQEGHREWAKPMAGRVALARILGHGLLVSEGAFWLRQRRLAQPAFHPARLARFGAHMVAAAAATERRWAASADRGEPFDVAKDIMRLTLRIVQETLLGAQTPADADDVGRAVTGVLRETRRRMRDLLVEPTWVPSRRNRAFEDHLATLDRAVGRMIAERRRTGGGGEDLLGTFLDAVDEDGGRMNDRQLRDEVMTMFLAGHETTANALAWTFELLGRHPDVQRRLRAHLREVLGDRAATVEDVPRLGRVRMVLSEAMRLYPPAWVTARMPRRDTELGGFFIPAGSRVFVSPYVVHRHPDLWENPEGFDPERFADPAALDRFAYFPFGGGPRLCIGHRFAMMEGILLLATLLRDLHLERVSARPAVPEAMITLRPRDGVWVRARRIPRGEAGVGREPSAPPTA